MQSPQTNKLRDLMKTQNINKQIATKKKREKAKYSMSNPLP